MVLSINKNIQNQDPVLAWIWFFVTVIITCLIINSITPPPISLTSNCGLPTIDECNTKIIEDAKNEIRKDLPSSLEKFKSVRDILSFLFPFKLILLIKNEGSESILEISNPPKKFHLDAVSLDCKLTANSVVIKSNDQIELGTIILSENTQNDTDKVLTRFNDFQGCTFLLKRNEIKFIPPQGTLVAPNAYVIFEALTKPYLEFKIPIISSTFFQVFIAVFATIGVFFAGLKQFLTVKRKGMSYFSLDE